MSNSATNPIAYRFDTSTPREYFILENRQRTGFDQNIPGTGLLIYRVSVTDQEIRANKVNTGHPQKVYPVCASATVNPGGTPASYGSINSAGCPFPGALNKTSFTDYTIPGATAWNGNNTLKPLTEIQEQAGVVSFRFSMPDTEPVSNFQAVVENQNTVRLTWNKPAGDVIGYNIYRNNLLLIRLLDNNHNSYIQHNVGSGNHYYCVTAIYDNKESIPICKEVRIINSPIDGNAPVVQKLEARNINENKDIELKWQSPFVSDWVSHAKNITHFIYYNNINRFTSAARFTVEDLRNLYGSKLTKVRFRVNNTDCKYAIQIWLPDKEKLPGAPVINQAVTNLTVNNPSDKIVEVTLNTPVSLVSNKELWIGIQYELNPMTFVAGIERGNIAPDRNWILVDNKWTRMEDFSSNADFNWSISGYLQFDNSFLTAPAAFDWLRSSNTLATNYIIYRNNQKIATTKQSIFIDSKPESGHHIYCISIAYDDGKESEPVCVEAISSNNTSLIQDNLLNEEIAIYPNPIKKGENLIIHCDPNSILTLSLFNASGQLMHQEQITGPVFYKKMDFEPGIYLLQIRNGSKTITQRIIINN
jgi:hypothetical protein